MKVIKNIKKKTKQYSENNIEHKAREKIFKELEKKYKILVETSGEGMLLTNRQGFLTYVNPTLEKMFKINASESLGTHFTKYLTKISALKSIKLFFELLKGKPFKLLELEAVNKKKQVFPIDVSASPVIKKEKIEGMVCIIRDITERKKAEVEIHDKNDELKVQNEKLQSIVDKLAKARAYNEGLIKTMSDGLAVINLEGKVTDTNDALLKIFSLKSQEIMGLPFGQVLGSVTDPAELKKANDIMKQVFAGTSVRNAEMPFTNKGGKKMTVSVSPNLVSDVKGNPMMVFIVVRDITERKKAEEALQESEKKFRNLFESSRDAIMTLEPPSWKFTSGNQATVEMFGARNAEEFSSLGPWNVSPERQPDGRDSALKAKEMIEKAMHDGSNFFEWTHKRLGGADFPATVLLTRMEQGGKKILQATVRDISAQNKAEAAVLEEKKKLEKYLNVAGAIILFLSPEGKILLINKRGCEILGYEPEDILNKDWFTDFIPVKDIAKARVAFDGLIEGKADEIKYLETHILTKNKNQMNIGWGSVVIKDGPGKRQTVLSTGIDISELEQAKTTINQLSEVNKLKDDFLNIATHELKTPLTTIIGLSEIMKEQNNSLNPEYQKYLNIINAEGHKLNHIIKRVLTVTRFESGREIIAKEKINLKELIFSFLPSLEVVTSKKDVKIAIDIKDENINLISDKEKISEVIYNFIDNAVKHSSAGQTITISVSRFSPKFAKIEVIDQGEGIAKKLQSKLFAKFSQLDSSLSRSQEGTGLGLYICKLIVEKLGGEIGVKSALGKGSSFFFTLPIVA